MKISIPLGIVAGTLLLGSGVKAATLTTSQTTNTVIEWNKAALQAIRDTRSTPPIAARALAITHTSIYDAWSTYNPVAISTTFGDTLQRPESENTLENKNKAISYAAYRTLVDLFPQEVTKFNHVMASLGYDPTDTNSDTTTATGIGNAAAQALLDFRHRDGSNQLGDLHPGAYSDYTGYTSINTADTLVDPSRWQPLRIWDGRGGTQEQKFLTPHWGLVTPFALTNGAQFRPDAPLTLSDDPEGYRQQAEQILNLSANLTDEHKAIAEYWADGPGSETPPGHWNLLAQFISQRDSHDLDDDVKLFFALTNAQLDASIAAWDTKVAYDSVRPVTAIRYLFNGEQVETWGSARLINGENWQSYIPTPAFGEYVSGHSAFSAASTEILKQFTLSDAFGFSYTKLAGTSFIETGPATDITLYWDTFSTAANQAGLSRLYGGIHFEDGNLEGRNLGRKVAAVAWNKAQSYISPPQSVPESVSIWGLLVIGAIFLCKMK
ncbi:vanadium-dependent haloperoxidase [Iningainema tapete]|uniref:Phosphatase PAP2 family protein n=1 Tax=Iningainema tapete BLCC-T55 TaxID=2748662 RepID=A0A8J7C0I9_9CYAN|nr:vanadium-dependent haloperoxidase [Iningainema tapete]MBD2778098.1 phosphatase PAP2 family protein [Iningainema tapete BLCC-T55]